MSELPSLYQSFIHNSILSLVDDKGRRETWGETVARYFDFFEEHLKSECDYEVPADLRNELETAVVNLEIMLPSMRALMTAGEALKRDNVAGYNCSYVSANKPKSFDEILYILMCGTGVGFSVEREFIKTLR